MRIRPASPEDLGDVRNLLVDTWHDTYDRSIGAEKVTGITDSWHSIDALRHQLEVPGLSFLVAEESGTVVGHILADPRRPPTLLISRLYVRPSAQRRGIGRRLIEAAIARHPSASKLFLEVEAENVKGIGFYRRAGFEVVGERLEAGIRHLQMRKPLAPAIDRSSAFGHLREPEIGDMDDRHTLFRIINARSFRQGGEFTLASGRRSTIYFNLKPAMLDPQGARLIGAALAAKAAELGADYVGGLELGAVPLVAGAAAMSAVAGRPVRAVFVRKAAKEHGTRSLVEGLAEGESLAGRSVVVVEDVTTTGGSALKAIEALRAAGAIVADVVTVVDREEGAAAAFQEAGVKLHALFRKSEFARDLD